MSVYDSLRLRQIWKRIFHYLCEAFATLCLFAHLEVDIRCFQVLLCYRLQSWRFCEIRLDSNSLSLFLYLRKSSLIDFKQLLIHKFIVINRLSHFNEIYLFVIFIENLAGFFHMVVIMQRGVKICVYLFVIRSPFGCKLCNFLCKWDIAQSHYT